MKRSSGGAGQDRLLKGSTVLITGGTGSFGSSVLQRLLRAGCQEIRIFSRDEKKQYDMIVALRDQPVKFYIGDVRDSDSLQLAMSGVDFVFHAAALKQVPTGEFFPDQLVKTNVIGSMNVMKASIEHGVKSVVCLSTDKAVMPINAMGMTKALMEKQLAALVRTRACGETTMSLVRYGNVMCSRGSVIPLFISRIKAGEPILITDKRMTRFMLPLSEAVEMVLFAMSNSQPGDLFVRKSPSCTIFQLANVLMKIFGRKVEVNAIGVRLGEKIDETLVSASEMVRAVDLGDYLRVPVEVEDFKYSKFYTEGGQIQAELNSRNSVQLTDDQLETLLLSLPEVQSEMSPAQKQAA